MSCSSPPDDNPTGNSQVGDTNDFTRGVKNPRVIDLIAFDAQADEAVLSMIEERPWGRDPQQLDQLAEKFNNYLDYVLDGWFAQQYPQYAGKRVAFVLECLELPAAEDRERLAHMQSYAESVGVRLDVRAGQGCAAAQG